jgi:hypothetical protein
VTIRDKEEVRAGHHKTEPEQLAIHGGTPVRTEPLPLEFPGVHFMGEEEVEAAVRVLRDRSPFRYYGVKLLFGTTE